MRKRKFAICDSEAVFACHLMEYMMQRKNVPFEVQVFSEKESLEKALEEEDMEMLLVSSGMMDAAMQNLNVGQLLILAEGDVQREWKKFPVIYKYQPSEQLVAQILDCFVQSAGEEKMISGKRKSQVFGIYSPLGRCGKTCFALCLGQILAKKESVLYLNLEEYCGFEELLERELVSDLLDVMYFLRQKKENVLMKLSSTVHRIGALDAVLSVHLPEDLKEVKIEEWEELLDEIACGSGYAYIVLDVGSPVEEPGVLLSMCDRVYTPVLPGVMEHAKLKHYEKQLKEAELEEVLQKTRYVNLPFAEPEHTGSYYLERLTEGEMGDFVRTLLETEVSE